MTDQPQCGPEDCEWCKPSIGFAARKKWIEVDYGVRVESEANATSTISQQDADEKALAEAKRIAKFRIQLAVKPIGAGQL